MVTIKDVAREAKVSIATASRALNRTDLVAPDTRRRVREVAARLHYTPHGGARSLITKRTHILGVLPPDLYGEFFSEVLLGIDQMAQPQGYRCLVSSPREGGPTASAGVEQGASTWELNRCWTRHHITRCSLPEKKKIDDMA